MPRVYPANPFPFTPCAPRYNPVSLAQFNEQAFYVFYNPSAAPQMDDPLLAHQLALMFIVLAIGSLMDLARPAYNIEAEKYHQLARAALFQSPLFEEPTLNAVQTLVSDAVTTSEWWRAALIVTIPPLHRSILWRSICS